MLPPSPPIIDCHLCGKTVILDDFDASSKYYKIMQEQHVCFSCAFWIDKIATPPSDFIIAGGHYFIIHPCVKRPDNKLMGFHGAEFYFRKFDGTLVKSNNVWHHGEIPQHFRKDLPDTAYFLSLITYQRLKNDTHLCLAKGCWDRYHCLRYDTSCEKDGPFNIVPASHKIGNEKCPSFINVSELKSEYNENNYRKQNRQDNLEV